MFQRLVSGFSWLWRGIDPVGLGVQTVLTLAAVALAGWLITDYNAPRELALVFFILGNALGARLHLRWAVVERLLPRSVVRTLAVRAEGITLFICAAVFEGLRVLPVALSPESAALIASARVAFGIAAAAVAGHALISAPTWFADRELAGEPEARVRIPTRPPRLRLRSRSDPRTHN